MADVRCSDGVLTLRPLGPEDLSIHLDAIDEQQMDWLWEPGDREKYDAKTPAEQRAGHLRYLEECQRTFGPGPKWVFAGDAPAHPYVVYVDCDLANPHVPPGQANIAYTTHKAHRGKGFASRAVRLACAFLREHTDASEAHLVIAAGNLPSLRVAAVVGASPRETFVNEHGQQMIRHVIDLAAGRAPGQHNRAVWDEAAQKYVRESEQLLAEARQQSSLLDRERVLLDPLLSAGPRVVHLLSGHGLDDLDLVRAGAARVIGVDYSQVTAQAAAARSRAMGLSCEYVVGEVPTTPLVDECADLVYTGKGALIWLPDLPAWAREVHRLLRPGGSLFLYEAHPMVPLWTWEEDLAGTRADRSYFARSHINDSFPGRGAVEFQHTVSDLVSAVIGSGLQLKHLSEHPEPFWQPDGVRAEAWTGRLPNALMLLAEKPA